MVMLGSMLFFLALGASANLSQEAAAQPVEPPKGAIVLFGGKETAEWVHRRGQAPCRWPVENGELVVKDGPDIQTKREFGDYRLHLEFWLPNMPDAKDQGKSNSGVFNHGRYEIQILDSYKNPTYATGGCGSLYGQKDPDADAIKPPETWNTYDIVFRAARLDADGKLLAKPKITVWHNGIVIHKDVEIERPSTSSRTETKWLTKGPIGLQNHGNPVRFRNIWVLPID